MHGRATPPGCELFHLGVPLLFSGKISGELADYMAQTVDLFLARDMTVRTACVLDILLASHYLPQGLGLGAHRLPDIDPEDDRIAPGLVVEHRLDRRVGVNASVPISLTTDTDCRKRRRE